MSGITIPTWADVASDIRDEHKLTNLQFNSMVWYLGLCAEKFAKTNDQIRLCAQRWLIGKRKVTPPGTKRRRRQAIEVRKQLSNVPAPLRAAIDSVVTSDIFKQVVGGNEKAANSLIGMVMKQHKADPQLVKQLLAIEIEKAKR